MEISMYGSEEFYSVVMKNATDGISLGPRNIQSGAIGLTVVYSIVFAAGFVTNFRVACVISFVLSQTKLDRRKNVLIYILVLCCCNIVVLFFVSALLCDLIAGYWIVQSTLLCRLYLLSESLNKFCGPFLLAALSGTCYINICRRLKYKEMLTYVVVIVICIVLVIILTAPVVIFSDVIYLVVHNGTDYKYYLNKCIFNPPEQWFNVYIIYSFIFGYAVPALLFVFFYGAILYFVRKHARSVVLGKALRFWKVAKMALGLVLFYLFCWTPYWALTIYYYLAPSQSASSNVLTYLGYAVHVLPYVNCTGFPILYTALNKDIKTAYRKVNLRTGMSSKHFSKYYCDTIGDSSFV